MNKLTPLPKQASGEEAARGFRRRSHKRNGFFRALGRYYKDPSASILGKLVVFLAAIYVVCPIDLIPDVPIVGWLDDIGVMGLATAFLWRVVGRYRNPVEPDETAIIKDIKERRPFSVSP